jgi:hypothetical protein
MKLARFDKLLYSIRFNKEIGEFLYIYVFIYIIYIVYIIYIKYQNDKMMKLYKNSIKFIKI